MRRAVENFVSQPGADVKRLNDEVQLPFSRVVEALDLTL
jgi:hypothetical protein